MSKEEAILAAERAVVEASLHFRDLAKMGSSVSGHHVAAIKWQNACDALADLLKPIDSIVELDEAWKGWLLSGGAPGGEVAFRRLELAVIAVVKATK